MVVMKRVTKKTEAPPKASGVTKKAAPRTVVPDDEDYDEYVRPVMTNGDDDDGEIRGGWGASQETIDSTSQYAQTFKPGKDTQIIKILSQKPYAAFRRHWIDRVGIGKRPYVCLQSIGKQCPLCDIGDKPGAVTAFNIAICGDDGTPTHKAWECGVKLTQQLKTYNADAKIGPLDKPGLYFAVSMSEATQRQQKTTMVNPVRGRDLLEDWGTPPLSDSQIESLLEKCYKPDIVTMNTPRELEEVAAEMTGEDISEKSWGS